MSGGKISPEIAAVTSKAVKALQEEMMFALAEIVQKITTELRPLQQDVERLNDRVRNLEQGGGTPPDK